jgi:hypothetical protein
LPKGVGSGDDVSAVTVIAANRIAPQKTEWIVFQLIVVLDDVLGMIPIDHLTDSSHLHFTPHPEGW